MRMEVHKHSAVKAGNIWVNDLMTLQKGQSRKKIS